MRNSLIILGVLEDQDIDWFVRVGNKNSLQEGDCLIEEGQHIEFLGFVLEGSLKVTSLADTDKVLTTVYPGEIVGEVSLLDSRPPKVTLLALEPSVVLKISRSVLNTKLQNDSGFASRFYKAIGVCLAQRLIHLTQTSLTISHLRTAESQETEGENISIVDPDVLEALSLASRRFEYLLERSINA
ncbi:cyclic nucleotide-binding domain-containing protein [Planctomycetota bacterium]|nr:cyclic nucleotide-binding domain-containing protein [Planctomycetota bacterium]